MRKHSTGLIATLIALLLAVLTVWQLPAVLGLTADNRLLLASQGFSLVLVGAFTLLFRNAILCKDKRLIRAAWIVGAVFSLFTVLGKRMQTLQTVLPTSFASAVAVLLQIVLYSAAFGAACLLLYQAALACLNRVPSPEKESLFSKLLGNWGVMFVFFLLCWIPAWLAFWPGTFSGDTVTQFFYVLDESYTTHHPLLHTLWLGSSLIFGLENSADGNATLGLALYVAVQLILMAAIVAYACHWMRRRRVPLTARVIVTLFVGLFPMYSLWNFCAQKDVVFAGLVLLFVLNLADVWQDGFPALKSPWRVIRFVALAALMMLMRNNGIYALCLTLPFAIALAKGRRIRMAAMLAAAIALYLGANAALIAVTEAEIPCKIELLSIPLQQIARTLRDHPEAVELDTEGVLDEWYEENPADLYYAPCADPVKWASDYDVVDEDLPQILSLWARMCGPYFSTFADAFAEQNLPYYLPGATMTSRFDLRFSQIELAPVEVHSYLPQLKALYDDYNTDLTIGNLPGVRILSDTAFFVWLVIGALGFAIYRRDRRWIVTLIFLLAIWATCLLGPVAIIRYMLSFFYCVPFVLAGLLSPMDSGASKALSTK